jgi:hypothetical protein
MALVALVVLDGCRLPAPTSTPPPPPVLNAVLLPGQRLTFARPDGSGGYEAMPASSVILRFTSAWPLDGERVEITVSPFTGPGGSSKLTWVRRDDVARKQQLASAGYIETVVDGYGYSVVLTPPSALRTATGINVALRTSQGGTPANPASYSAYISLLLKPKATRTLPSAVFFDCTEQGGGGVGSWYNTCKNSSSIVARDVVLEGWVRSPGPNWFGGTNDPIWVEDWHYEFAPDPDFIEQMYGPAGAFASLGDRTLESAPTLLKGNPPGAPADAMPIADRSTTGQPLGITVNSFLQPDNRASIDPLDSVVVIKAELNAWHVSNQGSPLCGRYLGFCRNWIGRGPPPGADWIGLPQAAYGGGVDATAAGNAFWPYDPRLPRSGQSLGDGEYVRVSGTLWQDTDHGGVIRWTSLKPAFGGWFEIHPVDWIVRSTPPAVPKTIRMVETINWLPIDFAETRNLAPSNPMPTGAVLRCRELIDGRFTDPASVLQHSAAVQTADVLVQTTVSRFTPTPAPGRAGRFKAAYILWWEQGGAPRAACTPG